MPIILSEGQVKELNTALEPIYVPPDTATLYGVVIEAGAIPEYPIAGVRVSLLGTALSAYTGGDGSYEIVNIPAETYSVQFSHPDYETKVI